MVPYSVPALLAALAVDRLERLRAVPGDIAELAGTVHGRWLLLLPRTQLARLERIGWPCAGWAVFWREHAQRVEFERALEADEAAWHASDREGRS